MNGLSRLLIGAVAAAMALAGATAAREPVAAVQRPSASTFRWSPATLVHDQPRFADAGIDARKLSPGRVGSQFPRLARLADGSWLIAYMNYANNGYTHDPNGGTSLRFERSADDGRTWTPVGTLSEAGRDLDNGHIVQRADGTLLLAYRSVRWGESYRILARTSGDGGATWSAPVTIDANEGTPGSLSNPDRGVYEPFLHIFPNGDIAVMYASEKYATASPAYAQVISMKVSRDGGGSWGAETFPVRDLENPASRPGMPVWTRMGNGAYALVYELCATDGCNAWIKTSPDGRTWAAAMGRRIPNQLGAPYVLALGNGALVVTSNTHRLSVSDDFGATWRVSDPSPWGSLDDDANLWPALVQTKADEIAFATSAGREPTHKNGNNIQIKFGTFGR